MLLILSTTDNTTGSQLIFLVPTLFFRPLIFIPCDTVVVFTSYAIYHKWVVRFGCAHAANVRRQGFPLPQQLPTPSDPDAKTLANETHLMWLEGVGDARSSKCSPPRPSSSPAVALHNRPICQDARDRKVPCSSHLVGGARSLHFGRPSSALITSKLSIKQRSASLHHVAVHRPGESKEIVLLISFGWAGTSGLQNHG